MTKSDLYKDILPKLVAYLHGASLISEYENDIVNDELSLTHYLDAANLLMSFPGALQFKKVAKILRDGMEDNSEIQYALPVRRHTPAEDDKVRLMPFSYKSATLAVMPIKTIIKDVNDVADIDLDSTNSKILDWIWLYYRDSMADLGYVWECFRGQHENDYFLLTNEPDVAVTNWRLYSYAYLCFVNENRFERPTELNYNKETPFIAAIPFNPNNKYEQYFDAYNVMSESKYADDVLLRFLRMYQILEYMAFRRALADMTKGNIKENGFVRNVISMASKGSEKEFDELKKGLKDVLPDLSTLFTTAMITPDQDMFIRDRLMIKDQHNNDRVLKIVYRLRNCIVHNKESELHFMYANTFVYAHGIDLMKKLIEIIEPAIVEVINDPVKDQLEFLEQRVQVY